jgi:6-pyruvoyltetrahydropterin/6-carboxytetrahydropterin synthase
MNGTARSNGASGSASRSDGPAMPISLTRVVTFTAWHRYHVTTWSEAQNRDRFGALADSHPHDYRCEVTVRGPLAMGMVMDLGILDAILQQEILQPLGGQQLNQAVPEVAAGTTQPTCEVLAAHVYARLSGRLPPDIVLERVRIAEDATLHADCTGLP